MKRLLVAEMKRLLENMRHNLAVVVGSDDTLKLELNGRIVPDEWLAEVGLDVRAVDGSVAVFSGDARISEWAELPVSGSSEVTPTGHGAELPSHG